MSSSPAAKKKSSGVDFTDAKGAVQFLSLGNLSKEELQKRVHEAMSKIGRPRSDEDLGDSVLQNLGYQVSRDLWERDEKGKMVVNSKASALVDLIRKIVADEKDRQDKEMESRVKLYPTSSFKDPGFFAG
jgi:hypothetical protein